LPTWRGVRVLGAGREPPSAARPRVAQAVLSALRDGTDLAVLDLPRHAVIGADPVVGSCDAAVLVVPCDQRGVAAAGALLVALEDRGVDPLVVTRSQRRGGLHPLDVAEALGTRTAGHLRHERTARGDVDHGRGPAARHGGAAAPLGRALAGAP